METSEVLYTAADLIERNGWWQSGAPWPGGTPHCAANAIRVAGQSAYSEAHVALKSYLGVPYVSGVYAWNDTPDRTAAEVIAALRAAAVIEAAKEQQVVDGLAANGVVAAAVGAVSA